MVAASERVRKKENEELTNPLVWSKEMKAIARADCDVNCVTRLSMAMMSIYLLRAISMKKESMKNGPDELAIPATMRKEKRGKHKSLNDDVSKTYAFGKNC